MKKFILSDRVSNVFPVFMPKIIARFSWMQNTYMIDSNDRGIPLISTVFTGVKLVAQFTDSFSPMPTSPPTGWVVNTGGYLRDGNFIGILGVGIVVIGDDHISVSSILVEPSTGTFSKPIPPARSTEK